MFRKTFHSLSFLVMLISFITVNEGYSQTVSGVILDIQNRKPLPGAAIRELGTSRGVSAQEDGSFDITISEEGTQKLLITYLGYKDLEVDVSREHIDLRIFLEPVTYIGNEVFVEATRVGEATPFSFTNVEKEELEKRNLGQDVPFLLRATPSVVTTSDAGAGIGYTGIRIRGVDAARVNVTINGIPVNDAESHGVFWVDLPDLASSIENVQIQRGVGTSTNGVGAFGASVNLQTSTLNADPFAEVNTGIGSFDTRKANIILGSGIMENGWMFEGRLSKILSDGYIDRATADLNSFFLSGSKRGERSLLKADVFSGKEITYQAWYGVEESVLESGNRTFNEAGTEKEGDPYENQVDNYRQDYYQLHYSYQIQDNWGANVSLHYTKGQGYFEEYKAEEILADYGISSALADTTDLIRRRWLDNDYYGGVFSSKYESDSWDFTLGGGVHQYDGAHFGEVIWARVAGDSEIEARYYDNDASKLDLNLYGKFNYQLTDEINAYADAQVRRINYDFLGFENDGTGLQNVEQTDNLVFFNPKAGIVYLSDNGDRAFISFGVASKEPTREEYVNSTSDSRPHHETLYNLEVGYQKDFDTFYTGLNVYGMFYDNQLVVTGQVNDVGAYIRDNVESSYRIGLELEGAVQLTNQLQWAMNATISQNKIEEISEFIDDYDNGGQIERTFNDTDIAFSPNFVANSVIEFSQKGFSAEILSKYVSKQFLDNTQDDTRSIDAYLVHDVTLDYSFSNLGFMRALTATLLVNNVLDTEYETNGYTFGFIAGSEQRFNYYYPQAGRNFLFQLKWEF